MLHGVSLMIYVENDIQNKECFEGFLTTPVFWKWYIKNNFVIFGNICSSKKLVHTRFGENKLKIQLRALTYKLVTQRKT